MTVSVAGAWTPAVLFGFRGRIAPAQFVVSLFLQVCLLLLLCGVFLLSAGTEFVSSLMESAAMGEVPSFDLGSRSAIVGLVVLGVGAETVFSVLTFCSMRGRLNDVGLSGWWSTPMALPLVAALAGMFWPGSVGDALQAVGTDLAVVVLLALVCWPGQRGVNAFGPPPPGTGWPFGRPA